jgi:hypothetical protein
MADYLCRRRAVIGLCLIRLSGTESQTIAFRLCAGHHGALEWRPQLPPSPQAGAALRADLGYAKIRIAVEIAILSRRGPKSHHHPASRNAQHRTNRISWLGGIGLRTRVLKSPQRRLSQEMHQGSMTGAAFLFPGHQERSVFIAISAVAHPVARPSEDSPTSAPAPPGAVSFYGPSGFGRSIRPASARARPTSHSTKPATDRPSD